MSHLLDKSYRIIYAYILFSSWFVDVHDGFTTSICFIIIIYIRFTSRSVNSSTSTHAIPVCSSSGDSEEQIVVTILVALQ